MLSPGTDIGGFTILELLGKGGMGEVYRAKDNRLGRAVAIKGLPAAFARDAEYRSRIDREAQVLASLNHPSIATIHDILEYEGSHYLVMELVPGESMRERIKRGAIPVSEAVELFSQMAHGLAAAHASHVVHRDLKPDNVMVADGRLKILDFGLAKDIHTPATDVQSNSPTVPMSPGSLTGAGVVMGTPMYMSPEQARAKPVDHLTDVWSFGCCMYEALSGRIAFKGDTAADIIGALLYREPDLSALPKDCPKALREILQGCFKKEPAARIQRMDEIAARLDAMKGARAKGAGQFIVAAAAIGVVATLGLALWLGGGGAGSGAPSTDVQRAREELPPKILIAIDDGDFIGAYEMAEELEEIAPDHPMLADLFDRMSHVFTLESDPPGASVFYAPYDAAPAEFEAVGTTPAQLRVPWRSFRLRFEKDGFVAREIAQPSEPFKNESFFASHAVDLRLVPVDSEHADMVDIPAGGFQMPVTEFIPLQGSDIGAYYIDLDEVTNAEFKEFVDAGGYTKREWWTEQFVSDGRELDFDEAMAKFVDRVGRPGPAEWEFGDYPEGQENYPVTGVSWYEASAYAKFRGKELPTVYHWARAAFGPFEAGRPIGPDIRRVSNLSGEGLAPVGEFRGVGTSGARDMAGNAREWCSNAGRAGYYTMGGAWTDQPYIFMQAIDTEPWNRDHATGFRCALYVDPPTEDQRDKILLPAVDFYSIQPITDSAFETLVSQADYDQRPFEPVEEVRDDSHRHWTYERVSINAAYDERMQIDMFLPKGVAEPVPIVMAFPGLDSAMGAPINLDLYMALYDFVPKSGRALIFPHWADLYDKADGDTIRRLTNPTTSPEILRRWVQDVDRTLAYVATREDLRREAPAYLGLSLGTVMGTYLLAYYDQDFAAAVLIAGGFTVPTQAMFANRITMPFVMINGDSDYLFPIEGKQLPMFELLATPLENKKHVIAVGEGHVPDKATIVRESLLWLDKYQPIRPGVTPVE